MAYAFSLTKDTTNIYVKVTGITSSYRYVQAAYRKSSTSSLSYTDYKYVSGSSTTITISDLSPGTEYVVNVRYSADGTGTGTFIGSQTVVTDEEELIEPTISGYSFSGTTLILEFDDLSDCPYISVLYRKSGAGSNNETGYKKLTSRSNEIEITGLELGATYVISYRYSTDGSTQEGIVSYGSISMPDPVVPYIGSYNVSGNTITLYFSDLSDYQYINVVYRTSSASTSDSTGYTRLTSSNNSILLSNLEYGSTYVISYRYSADGITQEDIVSYGSISIPSLAVPQTTASVYRNTITLTFTNFYDCPYVSVLYRPSDASSNENTAYKKLTSGDPTVSLTDLLYGTTYVISYRYSIDGYTQQGIVAFGNVYITPIASDEQLVANCKGRWYNYAAGNTGEWSSVHPTFMISMGEYEFSSDYFIEAGVIYYVPFTKPSTSPPSEDYVRGKVTATSSGTMTVTITDNKTSLSAGGTATYTLYVQTINGTYIPIQAFNPIEDGNGYQFLAAMKPSDVAYTTGYEPVAGNEVNLKADDIKKFIHALDRTNFWFNDINSAGLDESIIVTGELIRAITYQDFYNKLSEFKGIKNFLLNFSSVEVGSPIYAANLVFLKTSINNMLGVL